MSLDPEVRRGGGLPFGMVCSKWVCDPRYSTNLRTLYTILVTYADTHTRDTGKGKPYRKELAAQLGVSLSTLDRTLDEMEAAGIGKVDQRPDPDNPLHHDANVYTLYDADEWNGKWVDPLPPGVKAADVAKAVAEARRKAKRDAGIVPKGGRRKKDHGDSEGGVMGDATPSVTGDATLASPVTPNVYSPVHVPPREPAASSTRSVGERRRPSTGSSARASDGASGAADKTKPSSQGTKGAATVPPDVRAVADAIPAELTAAVREQCKTPLPRSLANTISGQLAHRTVEQLRQRIERRWYGHGYAEAGMPGGKGWDKPVAVATALVAAEKCPNPNCEDGRDLAAGWACRNCEQREADRKAKARQKREEAARKAEQEQREAEATFAAFQARMDAEAAQQPDQSVATDRLEEPPADEAFRLPEQQGTWWCGAGCGRKGRGAPPQDGVCDECLQDALDAIAALHQQPSTAPF